MSKTYLSKSPHENVTAVIPCKRDGDEQHVAWLKEAIGSFPKGMPYVIVENDGPGEVPMSLNAGCHAAETEYVMPFGSDDVATPGMVNFLVEMAEGVDVIYPSMTITTEALEPLGLIRAYPFCPHRLERMNYITGSSVIRKSAFDDVGGYRNLDELEDWDLWLRMSRAGKRFKAVPEANLLYRQVGDSRNKKIRMDTEYRNNWRDKIVGEPAALKATFITQLSYAPAYVRCFMPARHLPAGCWDFESWPIDVHEESDEWPEFPEAHNTVIWQFPASGANAIATAAMKEAGIRVLAEVDDNYLTPGPHATPGMAGGKVQPWAKKAEDADHSHEAHRLTVEICHGLIATTEYLADRYRDVNANRYVCPNQVDPLDWPELEKPDDGIFRIGWFASKSHVGDTPIVQQALEWASEQKDVEIVVMGIDSSQWKFRRIGIPWSNDIDVYRRMLARLDVGLAPVKGDPWTNCRSDLKVLEYAMAGVCPVVSDEIPYKDWHDGQYLWKAKDKREFKKILQRILANRDEAKAMAVELREHVLRHRTIKGNIWRWEEAIND